MRLKNLKTKTSEKKKKRDSGYHGLGKENEFFGWFCDDEWTFSDLEVPDKLHKSFLPFRFKADLFLLPLAPSILSFENFENLQTLMSYERLN